MDVQILTDFARFAHILAVAIGFGAAFLADYHMVSRLGKVVDDELMTTLHVCHRIVTTALVAMWVTGLVMIGIRTGFVVENFTPKLFSKLFVVAVLTANAILIGRHAMPLVEASRNMSLMGLPLGVKMRLAAIGAISTASWMMAMAMGIITVLATSGWLTFILMLLFAYGLSITGAMAVLYMLHLGAVLAPPRPSPPILNSVTPERPGHRADSRAA